jgi:tetratricopeptide (TPR) repeat protein
LNPTAQRQGEIDATVKRMEVDAATAEEKLQKLNAVSLCGSLYDAERFALAQHRHPQYSPPLHALYCAYCNSQKLNVGRECRVTLDAPQPLNPSRGGTTVILMKNAPTDASAPFNLGNLLRATARNVEECLRTVLRVAPDYADAMFNLGLLLQRQNQYAEAADYWRRYLANDCQSEWAARARRSLKFCEMQVHHSIVRELPHTSKRSTY